MKYQSEQTVAVALSAHDIAQIHALRRQQHAHQRKAHGQFIRDDLRGGTHGAEESIFGVGRPTGDDDAVHTERGHRQQIEQSRIHVRQDQAVAEGNHCPCRQCGRQRQRRCHHEQDFVGAGRNDDFLEQQFDAVGNRLHQSPPAHTIGTGTHLHEAQHLAFGQGEVGHADHEGQQ